MYGKEIKMLNYTLTIRNAKTRRRLRVIEYKNHSGNAMMDECFYWRQHYRAKGIQITTEW